MNEPTPPPEPEYIQVRCPWCILWVEVPTNWEPLIEAATTKRVVLTDHKGEETRQFTNEQYLHLKRRVHGPHAKFTDADVKLVTE